MKVYCSHLNKSFTKSSNYYRCNFCGFGWYKIDSIPLIVIGYTEYLEANPNYHEEHEEKDLTKKNWNRCVYCKDLLEKRKHRLCNLKAHLKDVKKQHAEFTENILIVLRGFRKDR